MADFFLSFSLRYSAGYMSFSVYLCHFVSLSLPNLLWHTFCLIRSERFRYLDIPICRNLGKKYEIN